MMEEAPEGSTGATNFFTVDKDGTGDISPDELKTAVVHWCESRGRGVLKKSADAENELRTYRHLSRLEPHANVLCLSYSFMDR